MCSKNWEVIILLLLMFASPVGLVVTMSPMHAISLQKLNDNNKYDGHSESVERSSMDVVSGLYNKDKEKSWNRITVYSAETVGIMVDEYFVPTSLNVFSGYMVSGNELDLYDNDSGSTIFKSEGIDYHYVIVEFEYNISLASGDIYIFDISASTNVSISVKYYNRSFGYYVEIYNAINITSTRASMQLPAIGSPIKIKFIVVALSDYEINFNSAYFVRRGIRYKVPYIYETSKTLIANFSLYVVRGQKIVILNDTMFMELLGVIGGLIRINYTEKSIIFISEGSVRLLLRFYDYWNFERMRSIIIRPVIGSTIIDSQNLDIYYRWSGVTIIASNEYNFSFAKKIKIINRNPYPIDNFTVRILMNDSVINMLSVLSNLSDVVFMEIINDTPTLLESYLAQWDGQNAVFYVKLSHIDAYSEKTIYVFFGSRDFQFEHKNSNILTYGRIANIQNITDEGTWEAILGSVYGFVSGGVPRLSIYSDSDKSEGFVVSNISFAGGLNMTTLILIDDYTIQSQQYNFTLAILSRDILRGIYISLRHDTVPYLLVKYKNYSFISYSDPITLPDGFDDTNYYLSVNLDPLMKTIAIHLVDGTNNSVSYVIYDSIDITGDYWKLGFILANISYLPVSFYSWKEFYHISRIEMVPMGNLLSLYNVTRSSSDMVTWRLSDNGVILVPSASFVDIKIVDKLGGTLARISDFIDDLDITDGTLKIPLNGSLLKINNFGDYRLDTFLTNGVNLTKIALEPHQMREIILSYGVYELVVEPENGIVTKLVDLLYVHESSEYTKNLSELNMLDMLKDNITMARLIKLNSEANRTIALAYISPSLLTLSLEHAFNNLNSAFQYFDSTYQSLILNFGNYSKIFETLQIPYEGVTEFSMRYSLADNKLRVITFDGASEIIYNFQNLSITAFLDIASEWETLAEFFDIYRLIFNQAFWKVNEEITIGVNINAKQISLYTRYLNTSFILLNKTMHATIYGYSTYLKLLLDVLWGSLLAVKDKYVYNLTTILNLGFFEEGVYIGHINLERNIIDIELDFNSNAEILFDVASFTITINLMRSIALQISVLGNIFTVNGYVVPEGYNIMSAVDPYLKGHYIDLTYSLNVDFSQLLSFREISIIDWYTDLELPEGSILVEINESYITDRTYIRLITLRGAICVRIIDIWFKTIILEAKYNNETFRIPVKMGVFAVINEINESVLLKIRCVGVDNRILVTELQYKSSFLVFLPVEKKYYVEIWLDSNDLIFNSTFELRNSSQRPIQVLIIAETNIVTEENSTIQNPNASKENIKENDSNTSSPPYRLTIQTLVGVALVGSILGIALVFIKRRHIANNGEVISAEKLLEKILEETED